MSTGDAHREVRTKAERWGDAVFIGPFMAVVFVALVGSLLSFPPIIFAIAVAVGTFFSLGAYFGAFTTRDSKEMQLRRNASALQGDKKLGRKL